MVYSNIIKSYSSSSSDDSSLFALFHSFSQSTHLQKSVHPICDFEHEHALVLHFEAKNERKEIYFVLKFHNLSD